MKYRNPYDLVTRDHHLRYARSLEEFGSDLSKCVSACSYSLIKKANITQELLDTDKRVLDVGCAYGRETFRYKDSIGLDLSLPFLRTAKHYSGNEFFLGDAYHLPFKDGCFRYIIFSEVFEHLRDPWSVLKELYRVLGVDGKLVLQTPNKKLSRFRKFDSRLDHVKESFLMELRIMLTEIGFKILEETGSTIPYIPRDHRFYYLNFNKWFFRLWLLLNNLVSLKWDIIVLAVKNKVL